MKPNNKERCEQTLNNYIKLLDNRGFEYVKGYQNCMSHLEIKCKKCGTIRTVTGDFISRKNRRTEIICYECERNEKKRKQELKRKAYELKETKFIQSEPKVSTCKECGNTFFLYEKRGSTIYCSDECSRKHINRTHWENRRAKVKNALVDKDISLERLIKRDNNVCYLCGNECNCNDYVMQGDTFIAGNYYPSIDHVQPLAKGGLHSWNNVRLAHRICNTIKSDGGYISPFIQK